MNKHVNALNLTSGNRLEDSGITYTTTDPQELSVSMCRDRSASMKAEVKGTEIEVIVPKDKQIYI